MRLRRSRLDEPGIRRIRRGRGFTYVGPGSEPIDEVTRERIAQLAIPPAWTDVWICPFPNGHIQAIGTDAAGRRQYRYHDAWRRQRDAEKFARLLEFARGLPELRASVTSDLKLTGLSKDRVLAAGIRLLDVGMFRIGGEEYAESHETFGVATIEKRHLHVRGGIACFDYAAKGGKRRRIEIADPLLVKVLRELRARRAGGSGLLAWREGSRWVDVSSHDINTYLKSHMGEDFSAKDFRTWDATLLAAVRFAEALSSPSSPSAKRRRVQEVLREVADSLGNTPAVSRKSYVDPRVLDRFDGGETIAAVIARLKRPLDLHEPRTLASIEAAVIDLLDDTHALEMAA